MQNFYNEFGSPLQEIEQEGETNYSDLLKKPEKSEVGSGIDEFSFAARVTWAEPEFSSMVKREPSYHFRSRISHFIDTRHPGQYSRSTGGEVYNAESFLLYFCIVGRNAG